MTTGTFKISLRQVALSKAKILSDDNTTIQLKLGAQKAVFSGRGKTFTSTETALFDADSRNVLQIYAYPKSGFSGGLIVYGQIKVYPLLGFPNTKNIVTVHTSYLQNDSLKAESSGTIQLEIIYFQTLDTIFEFNAKSAVLYRDTQVIGKMDPYVQIILEGVTQQTTVHDKGGKTPFWDENFLLTLKNIYSTLTLIVKDQDVTTSDIVGTAEIPLRDSGILCPNGQWIQRVVDIFYKDKIAGKLTINTKFSINILKK